MTTRRVFPLALIALLGAVFAQAGADTESGGGAVQRELLQHRQTTKKIEVFWTKPVDQGPRPALLFIHGHQEQIRSGG